MKTKTFRGPGCRVQLRIIDLTGPEVPASIRSDLPTFGVYVLRAASHPSTAFSVAGSLEYVGNDAAGAWTAVIRHAPDAGRQASAKLKNYLARWVR